MPAIGRLWPSEDDDKGAGQKMFGGFFPVKGAWGCYWVQPDFLGMFLACALVGDIFPGSKSQTFCKGRGAGAPPNSS